MNIIIAGPHIERRIKRLEYEFIRENAYKIISEHNGSCRIPMSLLSQKLRYPEEMIAEALYEDDRLNSIIFGGVIYYEVRR